MKFTVNQDIFINNYVAAIRQRKAVVFAGAGMSVPLGYKSWKDLLSPIADELGLDISDELDLVALAQMYVDIKGSRGSINQLLRNEYDRNVEPSESHLILSRLPIDSYWTTNYDNLIEKTLESAGKSVDVKTIDEDFVTFLSNKDVLVYKMHGDIKSVARTVLTKHEYEDYNLERELFYSFFKSEFISKSFLFIGFSFTDPNLDFLISKIRVILRSNIPNDDYYFIKKESNPKSLKRQELKAQSLQRYGLNPIWIDNYDEIPIILKEVEKRYLRNIVFISGSANEYGEMTNDEGQNFIYSLSKSLSANGYKILTGFGLGVGSFVINGVLDNMGSKRTYQVDNFLIMRPFPQSANLKSIWTQYRKEFVPLAGIAVFVFGNKLSNEGTLLNATGMEEEFAIAVKKGLKIVPIGATGYVAEEIWNKVLVNFDEYYPSGIITKDEFKQLGDKTQGVKGLIKTTIYIINKLNKK